MTAITLNLDDGARTMIEDWVREGKYASSEEVVEAGIHFVREQMAADQWQPSAEDLAAIDEGLADIKAGRIHSIEEVRTYFRDRYTTGA